MRVFLLDLWLDLRAKRLAPVAVILLAAIVAVPIVIAKGRKATPPTPAVTTPTTASAAPVISSPAQEGPASSKLQTFSSRDPFEPTGKVATAAPTTTPGAAVGTGGTTGTTTTPSGPGTTTTPSGPGSTTPTKITRFTYTVDLRFGPPGAEKLNKGVQRLELIPDQTNPQIVFLGVTITGKTAVFLVSQSLGVDTNGKCRPSADQCTFLYLRPDGTHDQAELTDQNGNTFRLHLLKIHQVVVSSSTGGSTNSGGGKSGNSGRSPAFTGSADRNTSDNGANQTPPGEPAQPFTFQGFFGDESASGPSGG